MPSGANRAVIAAAGTGKTELILEEALGPGERRVLVTTFTDENQRHIRARLQQRLGVIPSSIDVMGWFTFLINQAARPYQSAVTSEVGRLGALNFVGKAPRHVAKTNSAFYLDRNNDIYRDRVSDFVCQANELSDGLVIARLENVYSHVLIDEFQDLGGYDLDFVESLFRSNIDVTVAGDLRQHTYSTNANQRNKKYRGEGLLDWLKERSDLCDLEVWNESGRCCQPICDFADQLFPDFLPTASANKEAAEHSGVFIVRPEDVPAYVDRWNPQVLRHQRKSRTMGLPAMNFGVSKGRTFDRVLIFPTGPMLNYLRAGDLSKLKDKSRFYVAVTRARHSVAFVTEVPKEGFSVAAEVWAP